MAIEEIKKKLTQIFEDVLEVDAITLSRETIAADIEEWDSLAQISLIVAIEKEFNISLSLAEIQQLQNVGDMFDIIQQKVSG